MYCSKRLTTIFAVALALALVINSNLFAAAQEDPSQAGGSSSDGAAKTVAQLLKEGTAATTAGRFGDAIQKFDAAIAADPDNYLTYYRRATAYLSSSKTSSALSDLDKLLRLNSKFSQAHLLRAKLLTREGDLELAKTAIKEYLKLKKDDEEGKQLSQNIDSALSNLKSLRSARDNVKNNVAKGKDVSSDKNLLARTDDCLRYAGLVLEVSPSLLEARRIRAECQLAKGNVEDAMADWTRIAHLSPSTTLLLRLSSLSYYIFGDGDSHYREAGLSHLKTCLTSDPDNKLCAKAHRRLKAIDKALKKAHNFQESSSWRAVIGALKGPKVGQPTVLELAQKAIEEDVKAKVDGESLLPESIKEPVKESALLHELNELHCQAYLELDEVKRAKPYCDKVLEKDPENKHGLVARAEEHLKEERCEEAVRDLTKAFEKSGQTDRSIHSRLTKAQNRLKLSKSKDYYKVLGVSRDADEKSIKKAYREKARQHHPDKGGTPEKMAEINEAFGVLNDPEQKARFDAGDDPNDPMGSQQGGFAHPFAQGGNPFASFFQQGGGAGGGGSQQFFFQQGGGGGGMPFGGGGGGQRMHFQWGA